MSLAQYPELSEQERRDLRSLCQTLDLPFENLALLRHALTLRSWVNENASAGWTCNQRLEFLGDAVLGLVVAQLVYERFCDVDEGVLTRTRASLVSRQGLAKVAKRWELGDYLYLGSGDASSGGRNRSSSLSDALEALLAALFLDAQATQGRRSLAELKSVLKRLWAPELEALAAQGHADVRSQLQERVQGDTKCTPRYRYEDQGRKGVRCVVYVERPQGTQLELGEAQADRRKSAAEQAARSALVQQRWIEC